MTAPHEHDYRPRVLPPAAPQTVAGTSIELMREVRRDQPPRFALFDFDGTLSLIREGWVEVMVPMMVEALRGVGTSESEQSLADTCRTFIAELTGKQTIYQMLRLCEEIRARGGEPDDPLVYKRRYHDRLMRRIDVRREGLRLGDVSPEAFLVPGSIALLTALAERGVALYLASGTDEPYVLEEAELLGLTRFFGPHVYGAQDDYRAFSKEKVIRRILEENEVPGEQLIGFGDGYVEIENVKQAGGLAVGVASDEAALGGRADAWKRERLIGVGADVIVPDFGEAEALVRLIWPA